MSETVSLKVLKCPSCGANLKAPNATDVITCVYCGNSIVPVAESSVFGQGGPAGVVRVEGIRSAASALAYAEQFFEEYDWEAFAYAQGLTVSEIDKLADTMKTSSADDKNTWFLCFRAVAIPFLRKATGCQQILDALVEEYRQDDLDAYSKFDAYKRIAATLTDCKAGVLANLEKFLAKAVTYGATPAEVARLQAHLGSIQAMPLPVQYRAIEDIPAIQAFLAEKNAKILAALAAKGIQAEFAYNRAQELIREKNYVAALNVLLALEGYADSKDLIEKIDKYFLLSDVLEVEGELYFFRKNDSEYTSFDLYPTAQGQICGKPIIHNISNIITNYADMLYYLDAGGRLKRYHLSGRKEEQISTAQFKSNDFYIHKYTAFLLANQGGEYGHQRYSIVELDLATGATATLAENVSSILSLTGNKLAYTFAFKPANESEYSNPRIITHVTNVETRETLVLGEGEITIEGYLDNYVVFTRPAPNESNRNLFLKAMDAPDSMQLVEQNIYRFCGIIAGRLFYYVGNSRNQTLIHILPDGTQRKEWPLYIHKVLFEQGGWLYFIRKVGYNAILCKSRLDGCQFTIIAADIEEFIGIKNGYLYYINDVSDLVRVRMDGSNLQKLCDDVETVLSVQEDRILFISVDDRITTSTFEQTTTKVVKSIYAVDFSGSGKIKLAYNVSGAKRYDDGTVYYIATQELPGPYDQTTTYLESLYRLDMATQNGEKLLDLQVKKEKSSGSFGFGLIIGIMAVAFLFAIIGLATESMGLTMVGFLVGFLSLTFGLMMKLSEKE